MTDLSYDATIARLEAAADCNATVEIDPRFVLDILAASKRKDDVIEAAGNLAIHVPNGRSWDRYKREFYTAHAAARSAVNLSPPSYDLFDGKEIRTGYGLTLRRGEVGREWHFRTFITLIACLLLRPDKFGFVGDDFGRSYIAENMKPYGVEVKTRV